MYRKPTNQMMSGGPVIYSSPSRYIDYKNITPSYQNGLYVFPIKRYYTKKIETKKILDIKYK